MGLTRFEDWPARLVPLISDRLTAPFCWGTHDCALFACDAVLAMTGTDLAADFRGRYDSAIGAARRLRELGFRDLQDVATAFAAKHGIAQIASPRFAQRGDVGLILDESGALGALAICSGDGFATARESGGLVKVPARLISDAWRI